MFERIKALFVEGRIDIAGLDKAVERGWVTEEEKAEIKAEKAE